MWKTILVPHDFSASADHAARLARDLAKLHGARLILVHVAEMPLMLGPSAAVVPDEGGTPIGVREYAVRSATAALEQLAAELGADGVPTSFVAVLGHAASEIVAVAEREHADLIVMSTHGRTGLAHLVVGSVAEKVVRHAPIPVLTIRRRD
jgi:universal stress protein A